MNVRLIFLLIFLSCAGLLGYAYYAQYVLLLEPCNLCILQRICFYALAIVSLIAVLHGPARTGQMIYALLATIASLMGVLIAGRHVWMQSLPDDEVPDCGPGLNYMLDTMPLSDIWNNLFHGSGSCADINWTHLGLSMPAWVLVWFIALMLVCSGLFIHALRKRHSR